MREWLGTAARLVIGMVWIWAGALKLGDSYQSVQAVRAYELLPESLVEPVGYLLPVLEVVVGAALVAGLLTRGAALVSALLFVVFIAGIASAWARGLQIDCGCFGGGGYDPNAEAAYPWEIARDAALLLVSLFLVRRPRTRLALDTVLFPTSTLSADPEKREATR